MTAALVVTNLVDADTTVLSASGFILDAPPSLLREEHVGRKWRHNANSTFVLADLASSQSIDSFALLGLSGVAAGGTFQLRLSSVDATGVAGDVFNSGSLALSTAFSESYGVLGFLGTAASARYVRIDISQPAASFIEAGRWVIGLRQEFETNFQTPWQRSAVRNSSDSIGVGGQTFIDRRTGYWIVNARFEFVTEDERTALLETIGIAIVNTGHRDILFITDTATTAISRDLIWGYIDGDMSMTQSLYVVPALYGIEFPIRQRL